MKDTNIIIAVAKLDGWIFGIKSESSFADPTKQITSPCWLDEQGQPVRKFKDYLESHDAIIPVIAKQPRKIQLKIFEYPSSEFSSNPDEDYLSQRLYFVLTLTPKQLSIALLKACGKWGE